ERQRRGDRKNGRAPQKTERIADVAHRVVEEMKRPRLPMQFLRALDAAECHARAAMCLIGRHAATPIFILEQCEMRRDLAREIGRDLAREIGVAVVRTQRVQEPPEKAPQLMHAHYPSSRSKRSMSPTSRRHFAVCSSRARLPLRVIA